MKKKARQAAIEWLRRYRSPIAETVVLKELSGGWVIWSNGPLAVVTEPWEDDWPDDIKRWYIARRDANLLGSCPMCDALGPVVINRAVGQKGSMVHEYDCVIGDGGFKDVFGSPPVFGGRYDPSKES